MIANGFDFFARNPVGTGFGQVRQADFNTIFGSNIRDQQSFQRAFDLRVTGFPLELPGGPLGVAAGVEYRVEGFKVKDSPEIFIGSVPIQEITTDRAVTSVNAEVRIPIVGSQQNITGIYNLELSLAGRYDTYEHVSQDAKVPKVTLPLSADQRSDHPGHVWKFLRCADAVSTLWTYRTGLLRYHHL